MRRTLLLLAFLLLLPWMSHAAIVTNTQGTIATWHTGSATLASNSSVTSSIITLANPGYLKAACEFFMPAPSGTPAANTNITVWFLLKPDGTNLEDAASPRLPDFTFPLAAIAGAQRIVQREILLPAQNGFQVVIKNNGTGVTINTTWTLKCVPYTPQM